MNSHIFSMTSGLCAGHDKTGTPRRERCNFVQTVRCGVHYSPEISKAYDQPQNIDSRLAKRLVCNRQIYFSKLMVPSQTTNKSTPLGPKHPQNITKVVPLNFFKKRVGSLNSCFVCQTHSLLQLFLSPNLHSSNNTTSFHWGTLQF